MTASSGELPPVDGTAFAFAVGPDQLPHVIGIGGDVAGAPSAWLYDGAVVTDATGTHTVWTRTTLNDRGIPSADFFPAPGARTHAAAVGTPTADAVYLFGGQTPAGVAGDLWRYDVSTGTWAGIALPGVPASLGPITYYGAGSSGAALTLPTPRTDAALAFDGERVAIFGGRDAAGNLLSDLYTLDVNTQVAAHVTLELAPRANAALALRGGTLVVYGGTTATGPTDEVATVALLTGAVATSQPTGIASAAGAAVEYDAAGTLSIVPSQVPDAPFPGAALVGSLAQLTTVVEDSSAPIGGVPRCNGAAAPTLGLPCQADAAWTSQPGGFACGLTTPACAGSLDATPGAWTLADVTAYAVDGSRIATASGSTVQVYLAGNPPALLQSGAAPGTVHALAFAGAALVAATDDHLVVLALGASGTPLIPTATVETCGTARDLLMTDGAILADTPLGVERFTLDAGRLTRGRIDAIPIPDRDPAYDRVREADAADYLPRTCGHRRLPRCDDPDAACTGSHGLAQTSDGTVWVARDGAVVALRATPVPGSFDVLGRARFDHDALVLRAVDARLAVLATDRSGTQAQTLALVAHDDHDTDGRDPDRLDGDDLWLQRLGAHGLTTWLTDAPQRMGPWLVRQTAGGQLEAADAHAP